MRKLLLLLPLTLAACGTLPEPFYGNPGSPEAALLAEPPAPVLMVPTPRTALLGDEAAALYAKDLAAQLAGFDVPSVAGPPAKGEWQIGISASLSGDMVLPAYVITGPDGKIYGHQPGAPVAAAGWSNGDAATLAAAAHDDAAGLSRLMTVINAQVQQTNPHSLENRAPRVFVGAVTGAPGDGDVSLPLNLSRDLPGPDMQVVKNANQADFTVTATIKTSPAPQGQIQVELDWFVHDRNGRVAGQVTQIHELSPTDIDPYWGDVAAAAATEAAQGIATVVRNEILKKTATPPAAPAQPVPG
ncbi:hypothetical protein [Acidocella sp.]|uniref:hypothetical protein n=1 Tax=Acidocella sp. TaxID=50710 RepID=UPI0026302665|nr:hypothetical protein [Acidocella sp.]